jgi:effector-binding domain-containing protein
VPKHAVDRILCCGNRVRKTSICEIIAALASTPKKDTVQKLLYGVVAAIALLVVVGFALPRHSRVDVSTSIDANPATVFALVNDFERTSLWSSRTTADPNARIVYSGPQRGVGATISWDGTVLGSGTQTITESRPFDYVATIINPAEAGEARTWFNLQGGNGSTTITWSFEHDCGLNLVGRYFALMVSGVLRQDYEDGLANLKELAETLPGTDFSDIEIEHLIVEAAEIAYLPTTSLPKSAAISEAMGDAYFDILSFIDQQGLSEAGAPISIVHGFSGAELQFDAAIPVRGVTEATLRGGTGVKLGYTYAGPVIRIKHIGSYRKLGESHRKIAAYLAALGIERNGDAWESYVSDPTRVAEDELLTYIFYPTK